jgi:hypothetical protein
MKKRGERSWTRWIRLLKLGTGKRGRVDRIFVLG